jgi:hypothetical protein
MTLRNWCDQKGNDNYLRNMTTAQLVRECEEAEIFDRISWSMDGGQPGAYVYMKRGKYGISIKRESELHETGFRAIGGKPTLIVSLSVTDNSKRLTKRYLGEWVGLPGSYPQKRDSFRDLERRDEEFRGFLHDVMQIFG